MYHYKGSLTTPMCNELVMWLVMDSPMHIRDSGVLFDVFNPTLVRSKEGEMPLWLRHKFFQMEALRWNIGIDGYPILDNYRPTQEVNDRVVYYYSGMVSLGEHFLWLNSNQFIELDKKYKSKWLLFQVLDLLSVSYKIWYMKLFACYSCNCILQLMLLFRMLLMGLHVTLSHRQKNA